MKITELARTFDKKLTISYPDYDGNWMTSFDSGEVTDGVVLVSECGRGKSPNASLIDYVRKIAGKRMAFNAYTDRRVELEIPGDLEA